MSSQAEGGGQYWQLIKACEKEGVEGLLGAIDIESTNSEGETALECWAGVNYEPGVKMLLSHGAQITDKAIDLAISLSSELVVRLFLEHGIDMNDKVVALQSETEGESNFVARLGRSNFDLSAIVSEYGKRLDIMYLRKQRAEQPDLEYSTELCDQIKAACPEMGQEGRVAIEREGVAI